MLTQILLSEQTAHETIDLSSFLPQNIFVLFNDSWKLHTPLPLNLQEKLKEMRIRPENPERLEVI